jgi:ABC-type branched-subunit amino acid transport system ATPase component
LSPAESMMMTALLKTLDPSITVLVIEHDMDVAFSLTDRITVLHQGRVVADGRRDEVTANPLVQEIYLGVS